MMPGGPKITRRSFGLMVASVAGSVALPRLLLAQLIGGEALTVDFTAGSLPGYISFSRPGPASVWGSNGVIQNVAADRPRFDHEPLTGEPTGLLFDPAAINAVPLSRDVTGWRADGAVPSRDLRSGQQLSGTTIRAGKPGSTLLFGTDLRRDVYTFSSWMRRLGGYGRVAVTVDGGQSWTDVSALLLGRDWVRVDVSDKLARPTVGFRLEESGDAIAVDLCQLERGGFATSEIITSATSGSRRGERLMLHYDEHTFLDIHWPPLSSIREDRHVLALNVVPVGGRGLEITFRTHSGQYVLHSDPGGDFVSDPANETQLVRTTW